MPRQAAQLLLLPKDELAALLSEAYEILEQSGSGFFKYKKEMLAVRTHINQSINRHCQLPESLHSSIFLSNDVLSSIFSHLLPEDASAARVCSNWAAQWRQLLAIRNLLRVRRCWKSLKRLHHVGPNPEVRLTSIEQAGVLPDGRFVVVCLNGVDAGIYAISVPQTSVGSSKELVAELITSRRQAASAFRSIYGTADWITDNDDEWLPLAKAVCAHGDSILVGIGLSDEPSEVLCCHRIRVADGKLLASSAPLDVAECATMCMGVNGTDGAAALYIFDGETLVELDPLDLSCRSSTALSAADQIPEAPAPVSDMTFHDGLLYVCCLGESVACAETGMVRVMDTKGATVREIFSSPLVPGQDAEDRLQDRLLYEDLNNGWRNPSNIAVADGRIYLLDGGEVNPDDPNLNPDGDHCEVELARAERRYNRLFELTMEGELLDAMRLVKDRHLDEEGCTPGGRIRRHLLSPLPCSSSNTNLNTFSHAVLSLKGTGFVIGH